MRDGTILIVDDDEDDLLLLKKALVRANISNPVQILRNGLQAINYLSGRDPFSDREKHPLPRLVLLDLKMPMCNGFDVLEWRRTQDSLRNLSIVVLSGSHLESDIQRAMELGASAYAVKLPEFEDLVNLAKEWRQRWL